MSTGDARERNSSFTFVYDATGPTLALEHTLAQEGAAVEFELGFDEPCLGAFVFCMACACVCVFVFVSACAFCASNTRPVRWV